MVTLSFAYSPTHVSCYTSICFPDNSLIVFSFPGIYRRSSVLRGSYSRTCRDASFEWYPLAFAFRRLLYPETLLIFHSLYHPPGKVCYTRVSETSHTHEAPRLLFWAVSSNIRCISCRCLVTIFYRLCLLWSSFFLYRRWRKYFFRQVHIFSADVFSWRPWGPLKTFFANVFSRVLIWVCVMSVLLMKTLKTFLYFKYYW